MSALSRSAHRATKKHRRRVREQFLAAQARYSEANQLRAADLRRRRAGECARKDRYTTQAQLDAGIRKGKAQGVELTPYDCPHCGGKHLTSGGKRTR